MAIIETFYLAQSDIARIRARLRMALKEHRFLVDKMQHVWMCLTALRLGLPKGHGVFSLGYSWCGENHSWVILPGICCFFRDK